MNRYSLRLREQLAEYREWIDNRDARRFELVLLACLIVSITILIWSAYMPGLQGIDEGGTARTGWEVWLGVFLLVLLEAAAFSLLLHRFNKTSALDNNLLLALVVLFIGFTAVARLLIIPPLSAYVIPVAALGMVVTVILNARSALLLVALTSLNIGMLTDLDMRYALVALLVGLLALYLVSRVATRQAMLGAGAAAMGLAALATFSVEVFTEASLGEALRASAWGLASGFLAGVLAMVALQIMESVFNLTTPLRLLELEQSRTSFAEEADAGRSRYIQP